MIVGKEGNWKLLGVIPKRLGKAITEPVFDVHLLCWGNMLKHLAPAADQLPARFGSLRNLTGIQDPTPQSAASSGGA